MTSLARRLRTASALALAALAVLLGAACQPATTPTTSPSPPKAESRCQDTPYGLESMVRVSSLPPGPASVDAYVDGNLVAHGGLAQGETSETLQIASHVAGTATVRATYPRRADVVLQVIVGCRSIPEGEETTPIPADRSVPRGETLTPIPSR